MKGCTYGEIVRATGGRLLSGSPETRIAGIATDSRKVSQGDLFIPLVGERFDGHDFLPQVFTAGAICALTQKEGLHIPGMDLIQVKDTCRALGDLARWYREQFEIPLVGITGSVGKTSTKEMVWSVLRQHFQVLKTEGNFNNEIGLPLTLLGLEPMHQAAVVEMGMRGLGEISYLTRIARPSVAIITNIGMSHIERLGSRQNILKAKLEILEGLLPGGTVILNGDDELLSGMKGLLSHRTVFYGMEESVQYRAFNITSAGEEGSYFDITLKNRDYRVHVPVPGVHHIYNALAAIAAGVELGMPEAEIIQGIANYSPGKMRQDILQHKGMKVINDVYNASPQSMQSAMNVLKDISGEHRTIAILGDMLEMGEWAEEAHRGVGQYVFEKSVDELLTVGKQGTNIAHGAIQAGFPQERVHTFENNTQVDRFLAGFLRTGDHILVKGSRGMKMEEIVDSILKDTL